MNVSPIGRIGILTLLAIVHLNFYVSALLTDHLQVFFPQEIILDIKTLDYAQIPDGARACFDGGPIVGERSRSLWIPNVYHPVTTICLGGVLQLFSIETGFVLFTISKLLITVLLFWAVYSQYCQSKNFLWASLVFFSFFAQAIEIGCGQYQFLLNLFLFLFLFGIVHDASEWRLSIAYLGSLLIKPVGLLWAPVLLLKGKWRTLVWGLGGFALLTVAGTFIRGGEFYLKRLVFRMRAGTELLDPVTNGVVYNLEAPLIFLGCDAAVTQILEYVAGIILLGCLVSRRITLFAGVFLCVCYFLLFYSEAYEYHYTLLVPLFVVGLLTQKEFDQPFAKICILVSCLPSPYFVFKALGLFTLPPEMAATLPKRYDYDLARIVSVEGICVMMLIRVLPTLALAIYVVTTSFSSRGDKGYAHQAQ